MDYSQASSAPSATAKPSPKFERKRYSANVVYSSSPAGSQRREILKSFLQTNEVGEEWTKHSQLLVKLHRLEPEESLMDALNRMYNEIIKPGVIDNIFMSQPLLKYIESLPHHPTHTYYTWNGQDLEDVKWNSLDRTAQNFWRGRVESATGLTPPSS